MPALSQSLKFRPDHFPNTTSTSAVVYPNTGSGTLVFVSDKLKGDGYFGGSDGLHTIMCVATTDFVGTVTMQATLATTPADSDWFSILDSTIQYNAMDTRTTSTADCVNFAGNFVWVRANVAINDGSVQYVLYNH
jgi:hypothetical protein